MSQGDIPMVQRSLVDDAMSTSELNEFIWINWLKVWDYFHNDHL